MNRAPSTPGRVAFVGSGPGDPGLLTVRARDAIAGAPLVVTDPDVPEGVLALVADGAEVRHAVGEPADVAAGLIAEATAGRPVVRLVGGDPLTADAVVAETVAVAAAGLPFDVVPGVAAGTAVPAYAGVPLGSAHVEADVRGRVDWAALANATGPLVLHATSAHLADIVVGLTEHGVAPTTPVAVTASGTLTAQKTVQTTLASLTGAGGDLDGPLVVTIGAAVEQRDRLSWWESRALYGWRVLVPRTKDQAGVMSDRLAVHGATAEEVPTIAVEPPRSPTQMERAVKGLVDGRYQWVVFTSTNAVRAVWEKFAEFGLDARAFSGVKIACVGAATAEKVRAFGIVPDLVPERAGAGVVVRGPAGDLPAARRRARPGGPGAAPAGGHRDRDAGRGPARAGLGDRRRHRVPHGARRAAARPDPRGDQDRRVRRGVLHLVVDGPQPGRDRGQAARTHDRRLHRPADGRDRARVRPAGGRAAGGGAGPGAGRRAGGARGAAAGGGRAAAPAEGEDPPPLNGATRPGPMAEPEPL